MRTPVLPKNFVNSLLCRYYAQTYRHKQGNRASQIPAGCTYLCVGRRELFLCFDSGWQGDTYLSPAWANRGFDGRAARCRHHEFCPPRTRAYHQHRLHQSHRYLQAAPYHVGLSWDSKRTVCFTGSPDKAQGAGGAVIKQQQQ